MTKQRIGIPRAFFYYLYYPAWRTFFETLGCEVITSPPTTKETVDLGIHDALAEACVPVKIFFGHVQMLKDKVDYLVIPRIMSMNGKTTALAGRDITENFPNGLCTVLVKTLK